MFGIYHILNFSIEKHYLYLGLWNPNCRDFDTDKLYFTLMKVYQHSHTNKYSCVIFDAFSRRNGLLIFPLKWGAQKGKCYIYHYSNVLYIKQMTVIGKLLNNILILSIDFTLE